MMSNRNKVLENRYEIIRPLGEGGFGSVFEACDLRLNKHVAVKQMKESVQNDILLHFFEREAKILSQLNHPALPDVTDYFADEEGYYLVMEYVPGESLQDYLDRLPHKCLDEAEMHRIIAPILNAVEYLHTRTPPIIHRDIKPGNIRITPDNRVFLVDFGLAKIFYPQREGPPTTIAIAASPGYAPPEQFSGQADLRSDLYSLGATMYTMLSGLQPVDARYRHTGWDIMPLRTLTSTVSERTERIVTRLLAKNPDERYQSVEELRHDLALTPAISIPSRPNIHFLPTEPIVRDQRVEEVQHDLILAPDSSISTTIDVPAVDTQPRSFRWLIGIGGGVALVALLFLMLWMKIPPFSGAGQTILPSSATLVTPVDATQTQGVLFSTSPLINNVNPTDIFVGNLPIEVTITGTHLDNLKDIRLVSNGHPDIMLQTLSSGANTLILRIPKLDQGIAPQGAVMYTLQSGNQVLSSAPVMLHDYITKTKLLGVKKEYGYNDLIINNVSRDGGPIKVTTQTTLWEKPDLTSKQVGLLSNGDEVEVLDDNNPDWVKVRMSSNADQALVGKTGWLMRWLVDDKNVPPPPTECNNIPATVGQIDVYPSNCIKAVMKITVVMRGFQPNEKATVKLALPDDSRSYPVTAPTVREDGTASFDILLLKQLVSPGTWKVEARGSKATATVYFVMRDLQKS